MSDFKQYLGEMQRLDELLSKDHPASKWIHDFVKSDNPRFKGKSKKERIKMALGAYYAKQHEEVEQVEEGKDYTVTVNHYKDGEKTNHEYVVKNANDRRHAKNIAMQRHAKKVGALKSGEGYGTDSMQVKELTNEEVNVEDVKEAVEISESDAYERGEENKRSADAAKKQGDMFAHHLHMADYHDNMAEWHSEKGRHSTADSHMKKSEEHHAQAMKLKEEVEQIDELNKSTLSSYVSKAATDVYGKGLQRGAGSWSKSDGKKLVSRVLGIQKAAKKLAKEEVEQVDEVSMNTLQNYRAKAQDKFADQKASGVDDKSTTQGLKVSGEKIKKKFKDIVKESTKDVAERIKEIIAEAEEVKLMRSATAKQKSTWNVKNLKNAMQTAKQDEPEAEPSKEEVEGKQENK